MNKTRKLASLLLALVMVLGMVGGAMAQEVNSEKGGSASITIGNASKGETYSVVKLFDASVTGEEDGSIVYTGVVPEALSAYFVVENGYVKATAAAGTDGALSQEAIAALKTWAKSQTPEASAESDGSALTFTKLPYGYYVVLTTQGNGVISVDSTNPNAIIYDKNAKQPGIVKSVDDADVYIGQKVTYTATSSTSNYLGTGEAAEIVTSYEISDTLPDFLKDVTVTSIIIDEDANDKTTEDQITLTVQQFEDKKLTIEWATYDEESKTYTSKYANGSLIIITYTAVVTEKATIDGTVGNINTVTLQPYTDDNPSDEEPPKPWKEKWSDDEKIFTYATALQKVDENKKPLAGAKFAANGLTVEKVSEGVYRVTNYDPDSEVLGTEMECDAQGQLVILGLPHMKDADNVTELIVTETVAPAGYNKLVNSITLPVVKTGEEIKATETTIYYDEEGKVTDTETTTSYVKTTYNVNLLKKAIVVVNRFGTELPSTGGIGTTLFYIAGSLLVVGALVLMITKRRVAEK